MTPNPKLVEVIQSVFLSQADIDVDEETVNAASILWLAPRIALAIQKEFCGMEHHFAENADWVQYHIRRGTCIRCGATKENTEEK